MNRKSMSSRYETFSQRIQALYRRAQQPGQAPQLSEAFSELEAMLEALRKTEDELQSMREAQMDSHVALEAEFQHYRELFECAPFPYLVTRLDGTIRRANEAAQRQLQAEEKMLMGRSLAQFVPEGQRRGFRAEIERMRTVGEPQELAARLQGARGALLDLLLTCQVARGKTGQPQELRWVLATRREASQRATAVAADPVIDPQLELVADLAQRIEGIARRLRDGSAAQVVEEPLVALAVGAPQRREAMS
jgi:PAS domain S-box-containing protein